MTEDGAVAAATRVVRVRTEVAAVAKTFDYAVPGGWRDEVRVGTRVRAPFHGRTVRGWVVDEEVGTPAGVDLLPLKSWLGWGPPPSLVELAEWAAWRWAGPASFFLRIASPETIVRTLPAPPDPDAFTTAAAPAPGDAAPGDLDLARAGVTVVRQPPLTDPMELVLAVVGDPGVRARAGSVLVLVPSTGWAERLTARLERRGCPTAGTWEHARAGWPVVVGNRAGAWAPVPRLAAVVVLDAHDAAYREESAPTYSAVDLLVERARARRRSLPSRLARPAGGARGPTRAADGRRRAPGGTGGMADPGAGGSPWRRPAQRHVLRGVRPPGPLGARGCRGAGARPAGLRLQPHRRRPSAGLPPLRRAGPVCPLRCGGGAAARRGGPAVPALRRDAAGRVCGVRPAAHEDLARRREPSARGVGLPSSAPTWGRWLVRAGPAWSRRSPRRPS